MSITLVIFCWYVIPIEVSTMKKISAITYFKSTPQLAISLGISQAAVSRWGEIIPEKQALRLERITEGALKYDPALYKKAA